MKSNGASQSYASDLLDAMVCGLPAVKREKWLLGMLACYTDDSGSDGKRPVFVLAGYIATVDQWKLFSDKWQVALKSGPRPLAYFKMVDAYWKLRQFDGWSNAERDDKLIELGQIIDAHVTLTARTVLYWDDYAAVRARYPEYEIEPYVLLFNHLMMSAVLGKIELKIDDPIKFIFDVQGDFGLRAAQTF